MAYKIAIDPGHGGKDPGAVGHDLLEKDVALNLAKEAARRLRNAGQTVIMTRDTDRFIDLTPERTPACDVSVSIHINSGGGQGLETWVSLFNRPVESKKLGQAIQEQILRRVPFHDRGIKSRKNSQGNADYMYMLRNAKGVPVLVECGFIDSAIDAQILRSRENLERIAEGIAAGILQYLGIGGEEMLVRLNLNTQVDLPEVNVKVNGKSISQKGVLLNINGSDVTYVPARAIAETLGAKVGWDNQTKTVLIDK